MENFASKHILKENVYWSAKLNSWNQRTDELYYTINVFLRHDSKYIPSEEFIVKTWSKGDTVIENKDLFERLKKLVEQGTLNF